MPNWNKGDKIVCVDPDHHERNGGLTKDKVYEVVEDALDFNNVRILNDKGRLQGYFPRRFILVQEEQKVEEKKIEVGSIVECVNAGVAGLQLGKVYKVKSIYGNILRVEGSAYGYGVHRFKLSNKPAPVVEKKEPASLLEEMKVKLGDGYPGTCSYAIRAENGNTNWHLRDVCHARLNTAAGYESKITGRDVVKEVALYLRNHVEKERLPAYTRFVDYTINRSPVSKCFIPVKGEQAVELGVMMDVNQDNNDIVTAAIFLRTGSEYSNRLKFFEKALDMGFSENVAYVLSQSLMESKGNYQFVHQGGGHHFYHAGMDVTQFNRFFKEGLFKNKGADPYKTNHNRRYQVFASVASDNEKNSLRKFMEAELEKMPGLNKVDDWGTIRYNIPANDLHFVKMANIVARMLA